LSFSPTPGMLSEELKFEIQHSKFKILNLESLLSGKDKYQIQKGAFESNDLDYDSIILDNPTLRTGELGIVFDCMQALILFPDFSEM
jgi:hypothetical protein